MPGATPIEIHSIIVLVVHSNCQSYMVPGSWLSVCVLSCEISPPSSRNHQNDPSSVLRLKKSARQEEKTTYVHYSPASKGTTNALGFMDEMTKNDFFQVCILLDFGTIPPAACPGLENGYWGAGQENNWWTPPGLSVRNTATAARPPVRPPARCNVCVHTGTYYSRLPDFGFTAAVNDVPKNYPVVFPSMTCCLTLSDVLADVLAVRAARGGS